MIKSISMNVESLLVLLECRMNLISKCLHCQQEAQSLPFSPQSEENVLSISDTDEEELLDAGGNSPTCTLTDSVRRQENVALIECAHVFCIHSLINSFTHLFGLYVCFLPRLLVYPPPPAKGGITVTNEDLSCLKGGEFLNDVVIDFYLK